MEKKSINQKRGPRTGNAGNTEKKNNFLAEKSNRTSYFQSLADMVMDKLAVRGEVHKAHTSPALEPISSNTRVKRGPTKGNK